MSDDKNKSNFESLAKKKRSTLAGEFYAFLKSNKKWWLAPLIVMLLALSAILILASSSAGPFIYTLF